MVRLWEVVEMAFPGDWMRRFPTDDALCAAQSGWAACLAGLTADQFKRGVDGLSKLKRPPSLGEFKALCLGDEESRAFYKRLEIQDQRRREMAAKGLTRLTHTERVEIAEAGLKAVRAALRGSRYE